MAAANAECGGGGNIRTQNRGSARDMSENGIYDRRIRHENSHWSTQMAGENSVSRWLDGLREGNDADVQRLWDRYFQRLVNLASAQAARACPARDG